MILIAASGSRKTEWAIIDGAQVVDRAETAGLNPFFHSRREISHLIRLQLPEQFFRTRYDMIYFYGAGCLTDEKAKIVQSSLISQLRTRTLVHSDLLGAARGLLQSTPGLVCILATGSNSCFYDGNEIVKNIVGGGYILGDEGSNCHMGKLLAADVLKHIAPQPVIDIFYKETKSTPERVLDNVYEKDTTDAIFELKRYRDVLLRHIDIPYCRSLVISAFDSFFERNIRSYDFRKYPLSATGSACYEFKDLFLESAKRFGVTVKSVEPANLDGLIRYHSTHD